jgi:hypothetical protein
VTSLLIAITCLLMSLVAGGAVAFRWVRNELLWIRLVLVPWMVTIHNDIQGKK